MDPLSIENSVSEFAAVTRDAPHPTSGSFDVVAIELEIIQREDQSADHISVSPNLADFCQAKDPILLNAEVAQSRPPLETGGAKQTLKGAWIKPLTLPPNQTQDSIAWPMLSGEKVSRKNKSQFAPVRQTGFAGGKEITASESLSHFSGGRGITVSENLSHKQTNESTTDISLQKISSRFPWAAKMNQNSRNLHRVTSPTYMADGTPKVQIPDSVLLQGLENQREYVIGQFYRCSVPSGGLIHAVLNKIWGRKCKIFVRKLGEFSYIFHIPDADTRSWVLQRGLWHVDDCIMFVSPWTSSASLSLPEINTIPVWVTLKSIPSQLYSILGIKWIASGLGEPMQTIKPWLDPTQLGEAKILVEIELDKPFPQRIAVEDKKGNISMIVVEYSWLPTKCGRCGQLGHKEKRCLTPIGQGLKFSKPTTSATCVALASESCPIGVVFDSSSIEESTKVSNKSTHTSKSNAKISEIAQIDTSGVTTSAPIFLAKTTQPISTSATTSRIEVSSNIVLDANIVSESADPNAIINAEDLISLATISELENMASQPAPVFICINETIESPISESAQTITVSDTLIAQAKSTVERDGSRIAELDYGSNKFASLISLEEEEDPTDSDNETDSMDLMTPSGKRILRERPVKPSVKARDMQLQSTVGGRGRGRGNGGGRG